MTITGDYTVFAIRYHPSSCTFTRPPLEVRRSGVWCGKHIRFAEGSGGKKPHGKPTSRGVWCGEHIRFGKKPHGMPLGGKCEPGTFFMYLDKDEISSVGSSGRPGRRRAYQLGKSLSELGCDALEVGLSPKGRHRRFVCQCNLV